MVPFPRLTWQTTGLRLAPIVIRGGFRGGMDARPFFPVKTRTAICFLPYVGKKLMCFRLWEMRTDPSSRKGGHAFSVGATTWPSWLFSACTFHPPFPAVGKSWIRHRWSDINAVYVGNNVDTKGFNCQERRIEVAKKYTKTLSLYWTSTVSSSKNICSVHLEWSCDILFGQYSKTKMKA